MNGYETDDSGFFEGNDDSDMTQSTHSSIYAYPTENGRRYHAYKQGCYFLPNDEREQDRMELQRLAIHHSLQGQLYFAPLSSGGGRRRGGWQTPPAPRRILDLGTGSGAWAVEMADRFPEAEVTGVDLSPIQPTLVPPNVQFEIDDVEDVWTWPLDHFDLIFSSLMLSGSIADRQNYFHQAFRHCKPGGYLEVHELSLRIRSDGGIGNDDANDDRTKGDMESGDRPLAKDKSTVIDDDNPIKRWCALMDRGIREMDGRRLALSFDKIAEEIRRAGFQDVEVTRFKQRIDGGHQNLPTTPPPPTPDDATDDSTDADHPTETDDRSDHDPLDDMIPTHEQLAGRFQLTAMLDGLDSLSLAVFTRHLQWSRAELEVFLVSVRQEFLNKGARYYWPGVVITARKP